MTLFRKPANQEDGGLMFQNNPSFWCLDARLFYRTEMWEKVRQ